MKISRAIADGLKAIVCLPVVFAALSFSMVGCAGNGAGLDANGNPISQDGTGGTVSIALSADFQSIQDNVFTPICSKCHIGAGAPEGLQLDAAHSYNLLVGVPSAEQPAFLRVKPGDPDNSYMVQKIEGLSSISGGQMPLMEKPLSQATIDAIRQWITNGAPNAPAAAVAQAFAVQATAPVDEAVVAAPVAQIVVAFTREADASLINGTTVMLERMDTGAQAAAPETLPVAAAIAASNASVLLISPRAPLDAGVYRVTLRGTGGGALADMNAATLGVDTSFKFTVERAP